MKIHVRGDHHLDVTPALREYLEKKFARIERYFEASDNQEATVTMSVTRDVHTVETMISVSHMILRAEERSDDMYASIDLMMDKLEKQLEKYKHKIGQKVGHRMKVEGSRAKEGFRGNAGAAVDTGTAVVDDDSEYPVVRMKRFDMKPMHLSEAILQMDMLGHDFFVFANAETEVTNVVYRRHDGQYGLIETN